MREVRAPRPFGQTGRLFAGLAAPVTGSGAGGDVQLHGGK